MPLSAGEKHWCRESGGAFSDLPEKWLNPQFLQTFTALFREFGYGL
jgi:hypothetical protein